MIVFPVVFTFLVSVVGFYAILEVLVDFKVKSCSIFMRSVPIFHPIKLFSRETYIVFPAPSLTPYFTRCENSWRIVPKEYIPLQRAS